MLLAMQRYAPICSREMSCRGDHDDGDGGDDDGEGDVDDDDGGNDEENDDEIDRDVKHFDQPTCLEVIPNIMNACSGFNLQIKVFPPVHRALQRPRLRLVRVSEDRSTVLSSPGDVWLRHLIVYTPLLSVLFRS